MNTDPFKSYRENSVCGSNTADIYIQCYDEVIRLLHSAARAMEDGAIEKKTQLLNRVFSFIVHLQAALRPAQGNEAAQWLNRFYVLMRAQIFEGSARLDPASLRQAAGYFAEVRKNWEESRAMGSGSPASNPSTAHYSVLLRSSQKVAPAIASDVTETSSHNGWNA